MAEVRERAVKIREVAAVLAIDAVTMARKLQSSVTKGEYQRAEDLAAGLQRAARDVKWLMQRQPKE